MNVDDMGEACKIAESVEAARKALPGAILMARFDGRSFSAYTAKAARPYDERIQAAMIAATTAIVEDLRPVIAYTQSDEISAVWVPNVGGDFPFGGKFQKIASVGASLAAVAFTEAMDGKPAAFGSVRRFVLARGGRDEKLRVDAGPRALLAQAATRQDIEGHARHARSEGHRVGRVANALQARRVPAARQ